MFVTLCVIFTMLPNERTIFRTMRDLNDLGVSALFLQLFSFILAFGRPIKVIYRLTKRALWRKVDHLLFSFAAVAGRRNILGSLITF